MERFAFGRNWKNFLTHLNDERIDTAVRSVQKLLDRDQLDGLRFLDIGCGSGLFSLAAKKLGATVHSFDYDDDSVECTRELKSRYFADDDAWTIEQGSILDADYLATLTPADIVYSWGVLHHTGSMWAAIENATQLVNDGGQFAISIYNDQGGASRRWKMIKRMYNAAPFPIPSMMLFSFAASHEFKQFCIRLARLQNPFPFSDWKRRKEERGMSYWHDLVDWIGGYPFEVAKPEEIFTFCRDRGFQLTELTTQGNGYGCNEFAFVRSSAKQININED